MLRDSLVDYGIWFGDPPRVRQGELLNELNEAAADNLRERMKELTRRVVPSENLAALSFGIDAASLESLKELRRKSGLFVQNAIHIAILGLIRHPKGSILERE